MNMPAFKVELFRFVDVLPVLHDSTEVARHIQEYFCRPEQNFPSVLQMGLASLTPGSMRARMAVIPAIAGTLGVLTCQCLGALLNWQVLSIVLTALNIPFFVMLVFIPETPVYLIGTEQIERAHKVLRLLRGKEWDVTK